MDQLVKVIQDLSHVRSLSEIVNIVRTAARQATGADGATFVLKDEGYCFYVDEDAIGSLWKGKRFPLTACISGWSMTYKMPVAIPDIFEDSRIPIEAYKPTFVKSLAMVPIRQHDPIGAIGNYWAQKHQATENELAILQAIADTTAVAIENIQLFKSLEDRVHELERAHRVKDEFLRLVSHELRTPLNSIMGWAEILVAESQKLDDQFQTGLKTIYRNSKTQCRVIDHLLDASSIVLGNFEVHKEHFDLIPVIQNILADFKIEADKKNLQFDVQTDLDQACLFGDAERLQQVFNSLIDNAIKFSSAGKKILVQIHQEGPSLIFKVRDSGEGIDLKCHPNLFNRFSQTEDYDTRVHGGLGLSLTIAKNIVEAHQGQITVTSEGPNHGAEFKVTLPMVAEVQPRPSSVSLQSNYKTGHSF